MSTLEETVAIDIRQLLTFYLGTETYGLEIERVQEIIAMMNITPVPKTPEALKGIINLRGNIIPVFDLRVKLGMETKDCTMHTAIIVVSIENTPLGFIVDHVEEVVSLELAAFSEPPEFGTTLDTRYIKQMAQNQQDVIMTLDLDQVFNIEELVGLEELSA